MSNWWSEINRRRLETLLLNVPQVFIDHLAWQSDLKGERWNFGNPNTQAEIDMMGRGWLAASERGWDLMWKFCHNKATEEELNELRRLCSIERTRRFHLRATLAQECEPYVKRSEKKVPLRRVEPLAVGTDVSTLYTETIAGLRQRYGGGYESHHQGEVIVFSCVQGDISFGPGQDLWQLFLLSGSGPTMTCLLNQNFYWEQMDTMGRIDVDCYQSCRLLQVVVSADRMKDMLSTTCLEILIEKSG